MFLAKICFFFSRVSHLHIALLFFSSLSLSLYPHKGEASSLPRLLLLFVYTRAQIIHTQTTRAHISSRLFIIRTLVNKLFQSIYRFFFLGKGKRTERRNTFSYMSTPARKRLVRDFKRLQSDPPTGISGAPTESNIMLWHAVMFGPEDTPWEGGTFKLTLQFTEEYPNKAPTVKFVTKMFHPNIYADGSICLDILQNQWSPIYDVAAVLTSIQSLLCDPNPNSPANSEAATLFRDSVREYNKRVQLVVENSWME